MYYTAPPTHAHGNPEFNVSHTFAFVRHTLSVPRAGMSGGRAAPLKVGLHITPNQHNPAKQRTQDQQYLYVIITENNPPAPMHAHRSRRRRRRRRGALANILPCSGQGSYSPAVRVQSPSAQSVAGTVHGSIEGWKSTSIMAAEVRKQELEAEKVGRRNERPNVPGCQS